MLGLQVPEELLEPDGFNIINACRPAAWQTVFHYHLHVIPRYESLHKPFNHLTGQGNFALGARFYGPKSDWISVNFGVRTFIYQDKLEPQGRGPGPTMEMNLDDADAAKKAADKKLAFNVVFFLGVSLYFPTTFQYTTRR